MDSMRANTSRACRGPQFAKSTWPATVATGTASATFSSIHTAHTSAPMFGRSMRSPSSVLAMCLRSSSGTPTSLRFRSSSKRPTRPIRFARPCMLSLPELQKAFSAAILFDETGTIEPYVAQKGVEPSGRLRIYRNNARENFLAALRAAFPVLERLMGGDYFRQLAFQYMQRFPSPSGNLHDVGERLPTYLQRRFEHTEYAYFP